MRFGKAKVTVKAAGCVDCGTEYSHDWEVARIIPVTIGKHVGEITIHRCGDCMAKRDVGQLELTEAAQ